MVKVSVADGQLLVEPELFGVVEEIAATAGLEVGKFWKSMQELIAEFAPQNKVRARGPYHTNPCQPAVQVTAGNSYGDSGC